LAFKSSVTKSDLLQPVKCVIGRGTCVNVYEIHDDGLANDDVQCLLLDLLYQPIITVSVQQHGC